MSSAKLLTPGGGGVILQPASSIASDVTVNVPVSGVNGGTLVSTDASGNVGIGTSSPAGKLQVKAANPQIWMEDSAGGTNGKLTASNKGNKKGLFGVLFFYAGINRESTIRLYVES